MSWQQAEELLRSRTGEHVAGELPQPPGRAPERRRGADPHFVLAGLLVGEIKEVDGIIGASV